MNAAHATGQGQHRQPLQHAVWDGLPGHTGGPCDPACHEATCGLAVYATQGEVLLMADASDVDQISCICLLGQ